MKQNVTKFSKLGWLFFGIAAFVSVLLPSCQIGLGAAVDTERPKLRITYPPKGAVIMDTFTLAGTVSDDVGLSYLKVTLTHKDFKTQYTYSSMDDQVTWVNPGKDWKKGTTWSASIGKKSEGKVLNNGWDLPDGEYFIDVEASDGRGSVYDRRSVTIDNTPPVFIVENLVYTENNTNDKSVFGHKINLIGEAKDENEISNVHFKVYNEAKEEILDSKLDYEMTSNGILLAQYSQRVPEDEKAKLLAENYNKIYGIDFGNDKPVEEKDRYLTAVLSDNARKYVSPVFEAVTEEVEKTLGTGEGNFSTEIYFTTTSDKLGISIDELKEYRKHLSENSEMDEKLSALSANNITKLDISDFSSVPKLHINPKLEPKWYINGFEKKDGSSFATAYMGAPITFNFEWGNNKEKFRPSNIRVVLAKLKVNVNDDDDFETVISNEEIKATTESNENAIILIPNGEWSEDLTETFTKSVKIENDLIQTPNCYRIFVFGHDGSGLDGQEFEERENSIFAFKARKSTQPPKIVFLSKNGGTDEENNPLPKDDSVIGPGTGKIPFWFKVLTDGEKLQYLPQIKVTVNGINSVLDDPVNSYFMLEKNPDVIPENPETVQDDSKEKLQYTFNWTLKKNPAKPLPTKETSPEWNGEFPFNISVSVTDMGGGEKTEYINFQLDNKEPVVTVEDVTAPDMTKTGNKLNGIVKIPVSFEDNNLVKDEATNKYLGKYVVYNEAGEKIFGPESVENKQEISLDTRSFPSKVKLEVYVEDSYGNIGKIQKDYLVDQNTDKPVLKLENLVEGKFNNFGLGKNNTIEGSVTDDDAGFGKIEARVRDYTATDWTGSDWYEISNGKTSIKWNFTNEVGTEGNKKVLISSEGKYKVQFKVSDSEGLASGIVESPMYDILSDSTKPEFGAVTVLNGVLDGSEYFAGKDSTVGITLELTEANLKKVTVNGSETGITKKQKASDEWEIKYNWVPGNSASGLYELEFIAEDDSTNTNYTTVTIHYVKELPVISDVEVTPELLVGDKVNGIINFKGNIDQSENETKIKSLNLELKQNGTVLTGYSKTIENSANFEWLEINTTLAAFTDKEQLDLVITATDIAGNSNSKIYSVNIDQATDKPVISFEEDKIDDTWTGFADVESLEKNPGSKKNLLGVNDNSTFYVYAVDDDAIETVTVQAFKANGTPVAVAKTYTADKLDSENKVQCDIKNDLGISEAGNYIIKVNAKDDKTKTHLSAENSAQEKVLYIVVDGVPPVIGNVKVDGKTYNGPVYISGKKDISFDVTEMHLSYVSVNGTSVELGTPDTTSGSKVYSYTVPFTPNNASTVVVIKADDGTGLSASREITINHDESAPVIVAPVVTPTVFETNTVNGIISISGSVSDDSGYDNVQGKVEDEKLEVKLERLDGTSWSVVSGATFTRKNQKFTLSDFDTTSLKDKTDASKAFKGKIRISVFATDRAGNVSGTDSEGNAKPAFFEYEVDQDSDLPIYKFTNIDADATEGKTNLFGLGKWKITGTVKDDDGAVKLYYKNGAAYKEIELAGIDNNKEQAFIFEVPNGAGQKGEQSVEFLCVEKEGAADSTNKAVRKIVKYAIDNQTPVVTSKKLNGREFETGLFAGADRTIELEVSDDNGIASVKHYNAVSKGWEAIEKVSDGKYRHHIDESARPLDGKKTEKYQLTDVYGRQSSEYEISYEVDTKAPDGTAIITVAGEPYSASKWLNAGSVEISVEGISDDNLTDTVSYKVTGDSSGAGNVQIQSGKVKNTLALSNGNSIVTYTYSDRAGNSKSVDVYVNVDAEKPEAKVSSLSGIRQPGSLTLTFDATDDLIAVASEEDEVPAQKVSGLTYAYIGTSASFSLTTEGGTSGYLHKIQLFKTTGDVITYPVSKTGITADVTIPSVDGNYQYYVVLEDRAGNKSGYTGFGEFTIDGTKPEVKINSVSDADTTTADVVDVNKIIRISGTAEDIHPSVTVPTLAVYAVGPDGKKTGSAIPATGLITSVTTPANTFASWAYNVDTTKLPNDNTKYLFEVTGSDSVGNSGSDSIILNVNQTSDRPAISLDSIKTDGTTTLSSGEFEWTVNDDDGAVKSVAVKVTRKLDNENYSNVETAGIDAEGFKTITAENGKYKYKIPSYKDAQNNDTTDGSYKLYFKVTDAKSNSFTSTDATTNALTEPRIKNGETETGNVLAFDVDGTPPVIETVQVQVKAEGAVSYSDKADFKSSVHYGGPKKRYIKLSIPVTDNVITDSKQITVKVKIADAEAVPLPLTAYNSTASAFEHDISFQNVTSGPVAVRIEAADNCQSSVKYFNIFVDNLGPDAEGKGVQYMTPSIDTEVTANVSISANINDDSTANSRVSSVKYFVPRNNGKAEGEEGRVVDSEPSESISWSTTDLSFSDVVMKLELKGLATSEGYIENIYSGHPQTTAGSGIYFIPVWFRLEDNCGNISYVEKTIRYNPDAVRPRIKQTYPVHNKTVGTGDAAKGYVVLGGSILLAGSAEDNVAVDAVYVQYDINGDGKYSKTDVEYLIENGYKVVKIEDGTEVTATDSIFTGDDTCDKWGIKVEGTTSWNTQFAASGLTENGLEIGGIDEDNNQTNPDNKTLNIRMCARDKDYPVPHTSAWTDELHISVNNTVPQFGQFYLIQNAGTINEKKLPYENGMFIKGDNWKLEGTVVDNDGISKVQIGSTEVIDKTEYKDSVTNYEGFTVRVPVVPVNGNFTVTLTAYDSDKGITPSQYNINIDNTAPAFKDGENDDTLVLYAGEYGTKKINSEKNYVQNSNGWTTIASKASEAGSGFARAVFYVERYKSKAGDTYTDRRFYNVMTGGRIEASAVTLNEDKLPIVTKEVSEVEGDHYSFTVGELNEHIRIGGLVIIGNVYKTITAIDETNKKITVSEKIESAWTNGKQNAQFVYAFVVDHTGESTDSDGNVKYDDGDGIVESLTKSANEYTWDASFDSHNIPDGPLTINVVIFDVAGNSRHGSVVTRITNNPPRITSVMLGTDLNRNGSIEDREYTKFYAFKGSHGETDTTRGKEIWNLVPSDETESKDRAWVIKNGLNLIPEFVGGKAPFYYVFSKASGTGSENYLGTPAAGTNLASATTNTGAQGRFAYKSDKSDKAVELTNTNIGTGDDDSINTYRFTFWDSTEESTVGVNTGWCILNVELKQDLEDSIKPVAHVHPFFWNGRGDGNNSVSWDGKTPNGHIELERDLTTGANGITGTVVNGTALGADPKVSGTIVIRGTAYDDTKLSKVIVTYDGIIDGTTNKCEASYDGSGWTDNSTANKGYSLSVTDLNGGVTQRGHLVEWALTIDTSKISGQTGLDKKVSVTAVAAYGGDSYNTSTVIDSTSGVTGIATFYATADQAALGKYYAAEDKALSHKADYKTSTEDNQTEIFDRVVELVGVKTAATSSDPAVNEYKVYGTNSQYQMDIVPYVTEVVTNLSSGKVTNPSVYNRTANGHYPVQSVVKNVETGKMTNTASEDIVLRGFNLGGTLSVAAESTTNNTALSGSAIETATGSKKAKELCFNASTLKSGRPVITVNNIPLMNNLNSNSARGECTADKDEKDYDNCYNRTPNYENNNLLTDDIEFDVWEFNDTIVKAANNQFISGFAMQINQNNKKIQYAFATSDRTFFSAKNATNSVSLTNSYKDNGWRDQAGDYIIPASIGFHVNESGTNWYSSQLDAKDSTYFLAYNNTNGALISAELKGTAAGIKDMRKSSVFASRTIDTTVRVYHAFYDKISKTIELKTGTDGTITGTTSETFVQKGNAGEYVSIAVTPTLNSTTNDTVCAVWCNASGVQYLYKTTANGTWSDAKTIFSGKGEHCQIAADANGGIHIAAFVNGGLQYAYAKNYSSDFHTCTVDSGNTGNNLKLDVALVNVAPSGDAVYRPMPVIGYYSGTGQRPKYAKLMTSEWLTTTNTVKTVDAFTPSNGISSDKFTGAWEVNYVPVLKNLSINAEEKIYAGLWKNSGQLATSASYSSGETLNESTYTNTSREGLTSNTYGNGTSNAILCYLADSGARVESAQMR